MKTFLLHFFCEFFFHVYILPLRNENKKENERLQRDLKGLYPTFKEWKLPSKIVIVLTYSGLYPTFKEWKPMTKMHTFGSKNSFISYL